MDLHKACVSLRAQQHSQQLNVTQLWSGPDEECSVSVFSQGSTGSSSSSLDIQQQRFVPVVAYQTLLTSSAELVRRSFAASGLGAIIVTDIPSYCVHRNSLLPLAHQLHKQPLLVKQSAEDCKSFYQLGWHHFSALNQTAGGQNTATSDHNSSSTVDVGMESLYNNPFHEQPAAGIAGSGGAESAAAALLDVPFFARANCWPEEARVPGLRDHFLGASAAMQDAGMAIAKLLDQLRPADHAGQAGTSQLSGLVADQLGHSCVHKGRLINYLPVDQPDESREQLCWRSWHTDFGGLTAISAPMYFDDASGGRIPCPDSGAGLYVKHADGTEVHAPIPDNGVLFLAGDALQDATGGAVRATPHLVRAVAGPAACTTHRAVFVLFLQPNVNTPMTSVGSPDFGSFASKKYENMKGVAMKNRTF
ncbi:MAG: hypothetical protein WDW38_010305 [Sanguina aurantia]